VGVLSHSATRTGPARALVARLGASALVLLGAAALAQEAPVATPATLPAVRALEAIRDAWVERLNALTTSVRALAVSDDTYSFVVQPNFPYLTEYFTPAKLAGAGIDTIVLVDRKGKPLLWRRPHDPNNRGFPDAEVFLAQLPDLTLPDVPGKPALAGAVHLADGPALVVAMAITDSAGLKAPRGWVIAAHGIADAQWQQYADQAHVKAAVLDPGTTVWPAEFQGVRSRPLAPVVRLEPALVRAWLPVYDVKGKPLRLFSVTLPRPAQEEKASPIHAPRSDLLWAGYILLLGAVLTALLFVVMRRRQHVTPYGAPSRPERRATAPLAGAARVPAPATSAPAAMPRPEPAGSTEVHLVREPDLDATFSSEPGYSGGAPEAAVGDDVVDDDVVDDEFVEEGVVEEDVVEGEQYPPAPLSASHSAVTAPPADRDPEPVVPERRDAPTPRLPVPTMPVPAVANGDHEAIDEVLEDPPPPPPQVSASTNGGGIQAAFRRRLHESVVLRYQPQIDLNRDRIEAVEALLCVVEDGKERVATELPAEAEAAGLGLELAANWLRAACRQRQSWLRELGRDFPVCVPVTGRTLEDPAFVPMLRETLAGCELTPRYLEIEVPVAAFSASTRAMQALDEVHQLGVRLCLDGFGKASSSLHSLAALPISKVRIHPALVRESAYDARAAALMHAIIGASRGLGIAVCAAGVDSPVQAGALEVHGRPLAQGAALGPPMEADRILALLHGTGVDTAFLPVVEPDPSIPQPEDA
jgi:EAL domain-containing protein (putative c-di-GMP-specific phosphodiesterase class I)/sensor domain CHASE-containing protein